LTIRLAQFRSGIAQSLAEFARIRYVPPDVQQPTIALPRAWFIVADPAGSIKLT